MLRSGNIEFAVMNDEGVWVVYEIDSGGAPRIERGNVVIMALVSALLLASYLFVSFEFVFDSCVMRCSSTNNYTREMPRATPSSKIMGDLTTSCRITLPINMCNYESEQRVCNRYFVHWVYTFISFDSPPRELVCNLICLSRCICSWSWTKYKKERKYSDLTSCDAT